MHTGRCYTNACAHAHPHSITTTHADIHTTSHSSTITEHSYGHAIHTHTHAHTHFPLSYRRYPSATHSHHPPHPTQCLKTNGIIFLGSILFMNYLLLPLIGLVSAQIGMVRLTSSSALHNPAYCFFLNL